MKHFNQEKLTHGDINCALEDQNELSKLNGMKEPYQNKYVKESRTWELENRKLDILQEIKKNVKIQDLRASHPLGIEFDWLSVGGRIPDEGVNASIINKHREQPVKSDPAAPKEKGSSSLTQGKDDSLKLMNVKMDENGGTLTIKDVRPNILSVEADKFLTSFFRILDDQI